MENRILGYLRQNPEGRTSQEIAWATGLSKYAISKLATKMAQRGELVVHRKSAKSAAVWKIAAAKQEAK